MKKTLPVLGATLFLLFLIAVVVWVPRPVGANPGVPELFSPYVALNVDSADIRQEIIPLGWPVSRDLAQVSSEFGKRRHPIYQVVRQHNGIDFAIPEGNFVRATGEGVVVFAGTALHYGEMVKVWHEGSYHTCYAHNSRVLVQSGDPVRRGDVIALSGSTGVSTGPHLHYEVRKLGVPQNPRDYLN